MMFHISIIMLFHISTAIDQELSRVSPFSDTAIESHKRGPHFDTGPGPLKTDLSSEWWIAAPDIILSEDNYSKTSVKPTRVYACRWWHMYASVCLYIYMRLYLYIYMYSCVCVSCTLMARNSECKCQKLLLLEQNHIPSRKGKFQEERYPDLGVK